MKPAAEHRLGAGGFNPLLIKLSGELFSYETKRTVAKPEQIKQVIKQIKAITEKQPLGLVIGGGNFFRGAKYNGGLGLRQTSAHNIGMLSTIVNGIVLKDLLEKAGVSTALLSAIECPKIAGLISEESIRKAMNEKKCMIFVAGTGNPFFTTDTNAVLRALEIGADTVFKATKVDGVYDSDPLKNKEAKLIKKLSHQEALDKQLKVMDETSIRLAQENDVTIRVFNLFSPNALVNVLKDPDFGSRIESRTR